MDPSEPLTRLEDYWSCFPDDSYHLFGDCNFDLELPEFTFPGGENQSTSVVELCDPLENSGSQDVLSWDSQSAHADRGSLTTVSEGVEHSPQPYTPTFRDSSAVLSNETNNIPNEAEASPEKGDLAARPIKWRWDDSLIVFPANKDVSIGQRRRRAFAPSRRREVALNRLVGVCIQCKLRKGSVSLENVFHK